MRTVAAEAAAIGEVAELLRQGGVAVIPTDTVYGLAAHPDSPAAVERIYSIKARDQRKPIALLAADAAAAARYVGPAAADFGGRYWPGALTVVNLGEGVRVPAHDWTRQLLAACGGALRVTSANLSGQRPATDAPAALADVGLAADVVVDDGISPGGVASTVVRYGEPALTVLRPGPVEFLTLASASPRRAKILKAAGVDFTVTVSRAAEVCHPGEPERTVRENALAKAAAVASRRVLAADTIVWLDGRIYGKPRDLDEAREFLRELSGKTHRVFTGVAYGGETRVVVSEVRFRELSAAAIDAYVEAVRPLDRAGAYDIDVSGERLIAGYTGGYENIMGLPLGPLREWGLIPAAAADT